MLTCLSQEEAGITAPLVQCGTLFFVLEGADAAFNIDVFRAYEYTGTVTEYAWLLLMHMAVTIVIVFVPGRTRCVLNGTASKRISCLFTSVEQVPRALQRPGTLFPRSLSRRCGRTTSSGCRTCLGGGTSWAARTSGRTTQITRRCASGGSARPQRPMRKIRIPGELAELAPRRAVSELRDGCPELCCRRAQRRGACSSLALDSSISFRWLDIEWECDQAQGGMKSPADG